MTARWGRGRWPTPPRPSRTAARRRPLPDDVDDARDGSSTLCSIDRRCWRLLLNDIASGWRSVAPGQQAEVRRRALEVIRAYRDRGCTLPPAPDTATLERMMGFLVYGRGASAYVPMMLEEMGVRRARRARGLAGAYPAGGARGAAGADHRRRHVRDSRGHPPAGGRRSLRDHREEPRRGRHLVREHLSGLPRGCGRPLLLLFLRAQPGLADSRAPARAATAAGCRRCGATMSRWSTTR